MPSRRDIPELSVVRGSGPKRRRTIAQQVATRRKARRLQQETVVHLSEFIARPLSHAWEDGRRGRQRWWGNLLNHSEELVDSETPPTFADMLMMAEVLAWHLVDLCEERGIPVELPDPPTPVQRALLRRVA